MRAASVHPWHTCTRLCSGCQGISVCVTSVACHLICTETLRGCTDLALPLFLLSFTGFSGSRRSSLGSHWVDERLLVWQLRACWNAGDVCARHCRFLAWGNPDLHLWLLFWLFLLVFWEFVVFLGFSVLVFFDCCPGYVQWHFNLFATGFMWSLPVHTETWLHRLINCKIIRSI